jgi:hypothetical protein
MGPHHRREQPACALLVTLVVTYWEDGGQIREPEVWLQRSRWVSSVLRPLGSANNSKASWRNCFLALLAACVWLQKTQREGRARFLVGSRTQWRVSIVVSDMARLRVQKRADGGGYRKWRANASYDIDRRPTHGNVSTAFSMFLHAVSWVSGSTLLHQIFQNSLNRLAQVVTLRCSVRIPAGTPTILTALLLISLSYSNKVK